MYHNNISERSSSRVLQQPGGRQTYNIFGGSDEPEQPQRKGRGQVNSQNASTESGQQPQQAKPSLTSHTSSIGQVFKEEENVSVPAVNVAAASSVQAPFAQDNVEQPAAGSRASPRSVNNIWSVKPPSFFIITIFFICFFH